MDLIIQANFVLHQNLQFVQSEKIKCAHIIGTRIGIIPVALLVSVSHQYKQFFLRKMLGSRYGPENIPTKFHRYIP